MRTDVIEAVGIDESGSLWLKRATETFPYVYREAMEVRWDAKRACLYSPKPREWTYTAWFSHIRDAARWQGVDLQLDPTTTWTGIDPELRQAFTNAD